LLKRKIDVTLYPEMKGRGYGGGYGGAPDSSFWNANISFYGYNLTVREILMRISALNGKGIWTVKLTKEELTGERPKWDGRPLEAVHSMIHGWRFTEIRSQ
jgi:hypothetical protein